MIGFLTQDEVMSLLGIQPPNPAQTEAATRTEQELWNLLQADVWTDKQHAYVHSIAKRIDVRGKALERQMPSAAEGDGANIETPTIWKLVYMTLLKASLAEASAAASLARRLKWLKVLFKTADKLDLSFDAANSIQRDLELRLDDQIRPSAGSMDSDVGAAPLLSNGEPQVRDAETLPLTVLFYESPIARAYLATLRHVGVRPERIVQLVSARDLVTKKTVGRWLPKSIRMDYAANRQSARIHHWPERLRRTARETVASLMHEVERQFEFPAAVLQDAHALKDLSEYCDIVDKVMISDLKDQALASYLRDLPSAAVLYTGGGIVPTDLLDIEHLRFLHVHPGYLPDIRGADCTLWSTLLHRRPSASCFYMAAGIDTGEIVSRQWLPPVRLEFAPDLEPQDKYRAIYGYLDPWVRAYVLRSVIREHREFDRMPAQPQSPDEGLTFHFMHQRLQEAAFAILDGA